MLQNLDVSENMVDLKKDNDMWIEGDEKIVELKTGFCEIGSTG